MHVKPFHVELRIWNHSDNWGSRSYTVRRTIWAQNITEAVTICDNRGWDAVIEQPLVGHQGIEFVL